MKNFILGIFFMTLCTTAYSTRTVLETCQGIRPDLEQILCHYIQENTHRQDVKIYLDIVSIQEKVVIQLQPRYQRELLFRLEVYTLSAEKSYKISGVLHSDFLQAKIESIFMQVFGKDVSFDWRTGPIGYAIVIRDCANLYMEPKMEEGDNLASQILYGTPLILWEKDKSNLYRVQGLCDGYMGWISPTDIHEVTKTVWLNWLELPKIYPNEGITVEDTILPVGSVLASKEDSAYYWNLSNVNYLQKILVSPSQFATPDYQARTEDILETAQKFLPSHELGGIRYVWGGANIPCLDCSGFVQLVFRLNQIMLPRDSDQQYQFSQKVTLQELQAGDLLFFSRHGKHPTHVGIYMGEDQYIHCSPTEPDGVKVNFLHGTSEYEQALYKIYFGAGRILGNLPK